MNRFFWLIISLAILSVDVSAYDCNAQTAQALNVTSIACVSIRSVLVLNDGGLNAAILYLCLSSGEAKYVYIKRDNSNFAHKELIATIMYLQQRDVTVDVSIDNTTDCCLTGIREHI